MNPVSGGILAFLLAIPSGSANAASLLVNGSFELGPDPNVSGTEPAKGGSIELTVGSTEISGWTVTPGAIDYIDAHWVSSDGNRSVDLDGSPSFGGIAQAFASAPGQQYLVHFDMAGNPLEYSDLEPRIKRMRVAAAGESQDFSFDTTGKTVFDMGWVTVTWVFTAQAATTSLELRSLDTAAEGYTGFFGAAIDNVSVQPVPEPSSGSLSSWGLFLLLAAIHGPSTRRRSRRPLAWGRGPANRRGDRGACCSRPSP